MICSMMTHFITSGCVKHAHVKWGPLPVAVTIVVFVLFVASFHSIGTYTFYFFTFLTLSTQLACALLCATLCILQCTFAFPDAYKIHEIREGQELPWKLWLFVATLLCHILLVHTFTSTMFVGAALVVYALQSSTTAHVLFIDALFGGSAAIIRNELVHTLPIFVFYFIISRSHLGAIGELREYFIECTSWQFRTVLLVLLQLPSISYFTLVNWQCVYGHMEPWDFPSIGLTLSQRETHNANIPAALVCYSLFYSVLLDMQLGLLGGVIKWRFNWISNLFR